jgi:RNA polymerase-binding transcription factor DksA
MNIEHFKTKLIEEKHRLVNDLKKIGRNVGADDWEAKSPTEIDTADDTEVADKFEELGINDTVVGELEKQLKDVDDALGNIDEGTYAICEKCGAEIEEDRLNANPSARTCKAHMN